jgi:hypothetical protein
MKTAIVSSAEVFGQPGVPLSADYWVNRRDGESYPDYKRRQAAGAELAKASRSLTRAAQQIERAIKISEGS